jgi:hypothetical protein
MLSNLEVFNQSILMVVDPVNGTSSSPSSVPLLQTTASHLNTIHVNSTATMYPV